MSRKFWKPMGHLCTCSFFHCSDIKIYSFVRKIRQFFIILPLAWTYLMDGP